MIEIVQAEFISDESGSYWSCWLEINQGTENWMLPATAPGDVLEADLQAYFDARQAELWRVAQAKQYPVDVFERISPKRILKELALIQLDDSNRKTRKINELCQIAGIAELPEVTQEQSIALLKSRLRG